MTSVLTDTLLLDGELRDAFARFDDDVRALCALAPNGARSLHARVSSAYRFALSTAAGRPHDEAWRTVVRGVQSLVAATDGQAGGTARAAAARLSELLRENADLLDD